MAGGYNNEAGYGSSSRLYEKAPAQLGMTPATYRKGGAGAHIGYTIVESPLGRLLVGATERGQRMSTAVCGPRGPFFRARLRHLGRRFQPRALDSTPGGWIAWQRPSAGSWSP